MKQRLLVIGALVFASVCLIDSVKAQQKAESKNSKLEGLINVSINKSDETDEANITYVEDGHRYKMRLNGSKISEMTLDGKKVPEEDYPKYDGLVKKILAQIEKDKEQAEKDRAQAEKDREQAQLDRAQAEKDRQQAEKDRELVDISRKQAEKDRAQAERDREQATKDRAQAEKDRAQAEIDRKQAEEDRKLFNAMVDELVKDKLVESRDALTSLELSDTKLLINGKEQPESLHSRFKAKYLKGNNNRIRYSNSSGSRHMSLD